MTQMTAIGSAPKARNSRINLEVTPSLPDRISTSIACETRKPPTRAIRDSSEFRPDADSEILNPLVRKVRVRIPRKVAQGWIGAWSRIDEAPIDPSARARNGRPDITTALENPIYARPTGSFLPVEGASGYALFVRESDFGLMKYPRDATAELCLRVMDRRPVLLCAALIRLAKCDVTTFEYWINCGRPDGVRLIQFLSTARSLDLYLVTDKPKRSFRVSNTEQQLARRIEREVRSRNAWSDEAFKAALADVNRRYPTSAALWWEKDQWS